MGRCRPVLRLAGTGVSSAVAVGVWALAGALLGVSSTGRTTLTVMVLVVVFLVATCVVRSGLTRSPMR